MEAPTQPDALKRYDRSKPFFPGEPWVALGLGIGAWLITRTHPSLSVRTLGTFIAATLVARAATGKQSVGKVMRWTPIGGGIRRKPIPTPEALR